MWKKIIAHLFMAKFFCPPSLFYQLSISCPNFVFMVLFFLLLLLFMLFPAIRAFLLLLLKPLLFPFWVCFIAHVDIDIAWTISIHWRLN